MPRPASHSTDVPSAPRRAPAATALVALLAAPLAALLPATPASASVSSDHVTWIAADDRGEISRTWGAENAGENALAYTVTLSDEWTDVRYTVVGGSGARAGENQQVLGGLGGMVLGTLDAPGETLTMNIGRRGGAGAGDRLAGAASVPIVGLQATGGHGANAGTPDGFGQNFDGGGGGGATFLGIGSLFDSDVNDWDLFVVAAGGGGAGGGTDHALCPGAVGGGAGQDGASGQGEQSGVPGSIVVHCQYAAGGIGASNTDPVRDADWKHGDFASGAPGGGGGGGGYRAGQGGTAVASIQGFGGAGGGAGGGGGGSSFVSGGADIEYRPGAEDFRGDGRVVLDYYHRHALELEARIPLSQPRNSGFLNVAEFALTVPSNVPTAELDLDGVVTATLNGDPVRGLDGTLSTGTIVDGFDVHLPPSGVEPHDLCFSYAPESDLLLPAEHCMELDIAQSELDTVLAAPSSLVQSVDDAICETTCTLVPAAVSGAVVHPRVVERYGIDMQQPEMLTPTTIELHWEHLGTGETGVQTVVDAERATEDGLVIGGEPPLLGTVGGAWPYEYVTFRPDGEVPSAGDVYAITAQWSDTELFGFAESEPLVLRYTPSVGQIDLAPPAESPRVGEPIAVSSSTTGRASPSLPVCCTENITIPEQFQAIPGSFELELWNAAGLVSSVAGDGTTTIGASTLESWTLDAVAEPGTYALIVRFTSASPRWGDLETSRQFEVVRVPTETSVLVDPATAPFGTARTATATVEAPDSQLTSRPTGTVQFSIESAEGTTALGSSELSAEGTASIVLDGVVATSIQPGTAQLVATYLGDDQHAESDAQRDVEIEPIDPVITSEGFVELTAGEESLTTLTATGVPTPSLSVVGVLPAGLTLTDHGDGTATLGGNTLEHGTHTVHLVASNHPQGTTDDVQELVVHVLVPVVDLPTAVPTESDGALEGVPPQSEPGQQFTVTATGFAPFAPVSFGFYSSPHNLGTVTADALGEVTTTVQVPLVPDGEHSVVAIGMNAALEPLTLTAITDVELPGALAVTGAISTAGSIWLGLSLLLAGAVLAGWQRARRS